MTRRGGERKSVPDVEALETEISDLRSQLDCAAQIIVGKDSDLERLNKEKEKPQQALNQTKQRMRTDRGYAVEGRSLASWDRCKRGNRAIVTNSD